MHWNNAGSTKTVLVYTAVGALLGLCFFGVAGWLAGNALGGTAGIAVVFARSYAVQRRSS